MSRSRWSGSSAVLFLFALISGVAAGEDSAKILLISTPLDHPPGSHLYAQECHLLAKCLEQTPGITTVEHERWPTDESLLENVRCVVLYSNPGGTIVLDPANRPSFDKLMQEGAGYVAIHWATDCDVKYGQDYLKTLGAWWSFSFGGLETHPTHLFFQEPESPVLRGLSEFDLKSEVYLRLVLMNSARPLIRVPAAGGEQIVAWTYERPKGGRSFGTTLGHFHENFENEQFRRLLVNGILWAAGQEVPAEGAPVAMPALSQP